MRCRFSEMNCCPPPALFVEKRVCRITLLKIYEKVFHTRLTFFYFLVFLYTMPAQHIHTQFFSTQEKNIHTECRESTWCRLMCKTEELEIETRQKVSSECLLQTFYNKAFNGLLNNIPPCGFFPHKCITLWPFYDEVVL